MSQSSFRTRLRGLAPGLIGIFFGSLWGVIAAFALPDQYRSVGLAAVILIGMGFMARLWSRTPTAIHGRSLFKRRAYLVAVVLEVCAIYIAAAIVAHFGLQEYFYSVVSLIVGLHFIGLWKATGSRRFLAISAAMCFVSLLSMIVPFSWDLFHLRHVVLGASDAIILWVGASEGS